MKQHYNELNTEVFERAVTDCFDGKWERSDVLSFIEKHAGIPRHEILLEAAYEKDGTPHISVRNEATKSIALALEETVETIMNGKDPEIDPPIIRIRKDGMTGKTREIALLTIMHQLIGHVTYILMEPLFKARLYPTQHASIPDRGQTRLKNQVHKYLRKKSLNIIYAQKSDCVQAYNSSHYDKIIQLVREDIPSAKEVLALLEHLGGLAPGGHLIIGGYIDAWLFNYIMSRALRETYKCGATRRGRFRRCAIRIVTFMDDALILTSSIKSMKKARKALEIFLRDKMQIKVKTATGIIKLLSVKEEKLRRGEMEKSRRTCPEIDMAGYRISRTHIRVRKRVFLRIRRQFLRGWKDVQRRGTMPVERAYAIASYYGFIAQSDARTFEEQYRTRRLKDIAGRVISKYTRQRNDAKKERLYDLQKRIREYETGICDCRKTAGFPNPGRPHKGRGRSRGGWTDHVAV